jgi:hypothetical protein
VKLKYPHIQLRPWGVCGEENRCAAIENIVETNDYKAIHQNKSPHGAESITWS